MKNNKFFGLFIAVIVFTFTSKVNAQLIKGSFGTLSPYIGGSSLKIDSKGLVTNRNNPFYTLGFDYTSPKAGPINFYYNMDYARDRSDAKVDRETPAYKSTYYFCNTPGVSTNFDKITFNVSYNNCSYISMKDVAQDDDDGVRQFEFSMAATEKFTYFINYYYNDTGGYRADVATSGSGIGKVVKDTRQIGGVYNFDVFNLGASYTDASKFSKVKKISLSKEIFTVNVDLSYYDVDANSDRAFMSADYKRHILDKKHLVLSAKKSF